jgi:2,3-bisphosphoglycerate-dependent phosphoglycerate mutase
MKKLTILFLLFSLSILAQNNQSTTIYLVRHAEKVTTDATNKDPLLTEKGQARAKSLARKLKKANLSAIYSTDFQRTKLTAKPVSDKQNVVIKIYDPRQLKIFAASVLQENKGQNVLIVGHSNSVLETIEALGSKRPLASITDQEYNYFFVVTINIDGTVEVKATHYGKPNSNTEGEQIMK